MDWPGVDERSAPGACFPTGTMGHANGGYYSQRAIDPHSLALAATIEMTIDDCPLLITPTFHGQGWGGLRRRP
ncbi:MAG: AMP-dependent synthetase, partial [Candidatus Dormibacteria bacterium]